MSSLAPALESEIYPLLDRALMLPYGKALIYPCSHSRGNFLERVITGIKYENAIESIEMYAPDEPLYGMGQYANIWAENNEKGLLLAHLDAPRDTLAWRIIRCAATKQPQPVTHAVNTTRTRLHRFRSRYPKLMSKLWIEPGPPTVIRYGEPSAEELAVVDIDVNPALKLKEPDPEDRAKSNIW